MSSEFVERDYSALVPRVVESLFPESAARQRAWELLDAYDDREVDRVRLGILRASDGQLEEVARLSRLAQTDYRDLLVLAEYPLTSRRWAWRESDPGKYERLLKREQRRYDIWLERTLGDDEPS